MRIVSKEKKLYVELFPGDAHIAPLEVKYRFILSGQEEYRELSLKKFKETGNEILFRADTELNCNETYPFILKIVKASSFTAAKRKFCGISFQFNPEKQIPWAVEIDMSIPLNVNGWTVLVQDLNTRKKQAAINDDWTGIAGANWQGARSPLEFISSNEKIILGRISTLNEMFSSKAALNANSTPVFSYKFTFDSKSFRPGPEFSLLLNSAKENKSASHGDIWLEIFNEESERFRKIARIKNEKVLPLANIPIDGGTPCCATPNKMKIRGTFSENAEKILSLCEKMNFKRILIGSPWISHRTEGIFSKCTSTIVYDSRCGIIELEVSSKYGGRKSFREFCRKAHNKNIEVFVWYPAFHLSNRSPLFTEHPDWIIRKPDGSALTLCYFHLSVISPRLEVQKFFIDNLKGLKNDCEFDGLWLDSYNNFPFMSLDYSVNHGASTCKAGINMVREFQKIGLKVINEGFSPFGARGDGDSIRYLGEEDMASELSLFTSWNNVEKMVPDHYFRFLANKAPLTLPIEYIPNCFRKIVAAFNRVYAAVEPMMGKRITLNNGNGVLWENLKNDTKILFAFKSFDFKHETNAVITNLASGKTQNTNKDFSAEKFAIYKIEYK